MALNLEQVRRAVERRQDPNTGVLLDTAIRHRYPLQGTIAEVVSLAPPRIELLSAAVVEVAAIIGATPTVGDVVLAVEVAGFVVAVTGVQVV